MMAQSTVCRTWLSWPTLRGRGAGGCGRLAAALVLGAAVGRWFLGRWNETQHNLLYFLLDSCGGLPLVSDPTVNSEGAAPECTNRERKCVVPVSPGQRQILAGG